MIDEKKLDAFLDEARRSPTQYTSFGLQTNEVIDIFHLARIGLWAERYQVVKHIRFFNDLVTKNTTLRCFELEKAIDSLPKKDYNEV